MFKFLEWTSNNIKILIRSCLVLPLICFLLITFQGDKSSDLIIAVVQCLIFIEFILLFIILLGLFLKRKNSEY